jgi:hypothetical protein
VLGNTSRQSQEAIYTAVTPFGSNQYAQISAGAVGNVSSLIGLVIRANTVTGNSYNVFCNGSVSSRISRNDNFVGTNLGSPFTCTYTKGDVFRFEAIGSTITFYKNGAALQSVTDRTYNSGNPGILLFGNNASTMLDNFFGGTLITLSNLTLTEASTPTGIAGASILRADVGDHVVMENLNNTGEQPLPQRAILTSAYTNATTTASNITGLSFTVSASRNYTAVCHLYYQGSARTAGLDVTVTGPASPTSVFYSYDGNATGSSLTNSVASAFGTKLTGNTTVMATTNLHATVTVGLRNGANAGTVQVQGSATGAGTVTLQAGSFCTVQ